MKIVWKGGDKPTGRYRAFAYRSWPTATFGREGYMAAMLVPVEHVSYYPGIAETTELRIHVAQYSDDGKWKWVRLKKSAVGVTAAKTLYALFLAQNPSYDRRRRDA